MVGASGQLGAALSRQLIARGDGVVGTHRSVAGRDTVQLDATDHAATRALIQTTRAEAVFFAAAYTHVDGCEDDPAAAVAANRDAPAAAAATAAGQDAAFVFYSTDYVFDGEAGPYGEDDPVRPLSVYGRSKAEGERAVLAAHPGAVVIRTTGAYGLDPQAKNFVYQVLRRARSGERMKVPADQYYTPTYVEDLAAASLTLVDKGLAGVFNVAGPDLIERSMLARRICEVFGVDAGFVDPVTTASLGQKAPRPLKAGLRTDRVRGLGITLRSSTEGLAAMREVLEAGRG